MQQGDESFVNAAPDQYISVWKCKVDSWKKIKDFEKQIILNEEIYKKKF